MGASRQAQIQAGIQAGRQCHGHTLILQAPATPTPAHQQSHAHKHHCEEIGLEGRASGRAGRRDRRWQTKSNIELNQLGEWVSVRRGGSRCVCAEGGIRVCGSGGVCAEGGIRCVGQGVSVRRGHQVRGSGCVCADGGIKCPPHTHRQSPLHHLTHLACLLASTTYLRP